MSDFEFREPAVVSEELRMLRDQARRFVKDVVEPHGEQWERDGLVPRSIFRELGDLGLLGARYPESCGGSELGPMASVVLAEEFSRSSFGGFASSVNVHTDMSLAHIVLMLNLAVVSRCLLLKKVHLTRRRAEPQAFHKIFQQEQDNEYGRKDEGELDRFSIGLLRGRLPTHCKRGGCERQPRAQSRPADDQPGG